jgi:hypothetical protein
MIIIIFINLVYHLCHKLHIRGYPLRTLASEGGGGVKQILTYANKVGGGKSGWLKQKQERV